MKTIFLALLIGVSGCVANEGMPIVEAKNEVRLKCRDGNADTLVGFVFSSPADVNVALKTSLEKMGISATESKASIKIYELLSQPYNKGVIEGAFSTLKIRVENISGALPKEAVAVFITREDHFDGWSIDPHTRASFYGRKRVPLVTNAEVRFLREALVGKEFRAACTAYTHTDISAEPYKSMIFSLKDTPSAPLPSEVTIK